jgi:uncharacterized membrane protein YkvA (DUF1232 family)
MSVAIAIIAGLLAGYVALLAALLLAAPKGPRLVEAVRLLPDLLRLVARLGTDRSLPRGVRVRLWLLLAYLAMPFDLIPDFLPVLGYADDVIVVSLVLRAVVHRAGTADVRRHWPGTDDGLRALGRLVGLALAPAAQQT